MPENLYLSGHSAIKNEISSNPNLTSGDFVSFIDGYSF